MLLLFCSAFLGECINSGSMTEVLSVILPLLVSVSLECMFSYIFLKWSSISLNLFSVVCLSLISHFIVIP